VEVTVVNVAERAMSKRKGGGVQAATEEKPFGRPAKPGGTPTQVRMDADIAAQAKILASIEGVSMTDYLSSILRPILNERIKAAGRKLSDL
jgi:hypothetical protein